MVAEVEGAYSGGAWCRGLDRAVGGAVAWLQLGWRSTTAGGGDGAGGYGSVGASWKE